MGRGRDRFWEYADNLNGQFLCKFCKYKFSGGSTRLKSHLSGVRGRDIDICLKVPEDVQLAARQAISAPEKKAGNLRSLNNDGETQVTSISAPNKKAKSLHQPTILGESKKDNSVVDKMLAKFIISNNITCDLATMQSLVDLLGRVAEIGPSYDIPNTSALTSRLIPGIKKEVEENVGNVKKLLTTSGCTLVMYKVCVEYKLVCINALAYTPNGIIYVGKIAVHEGGMTFSHLMNRIYFIIDSLGPENVVQCILNICEIEGSLTDFEGDLIFLSVHDMVCQKYSWILVHPNVNCQCKSILLRTPYLSLLIRRTTKLAAVIFRYLHKHYFNLLPQRDHTSNIKDYNSLRMTDIAIRIFVLRTILEVEKELQALQLPMASESCEWPSREENVAEIVEAIHSTEFWTRCKKVVQVLRPLLFNEFIAGYNGSTFGYLYEASKRTEEAIKQHCDGDDLINCETIIWSFDIWKSRAVKPVHAAAAFLNPAYFCSENFTEDTEMQKGLQHLMSLHPPGEQEAHFFSENFTKDNEMLEGLRHLTSLHPPGEQKVLLKQLQLYGKRMPDLFSDTAMDMLNTIHPRKWWECFGDPCPILQKLAVRILSQPCSATLIPKLANFQPNNRSDELRMNAILMENFGTVKSQNSEPIHLTSEDPDYAYEDVLKFLDENLSL